MRQAALLALVLAAAGCGNTNTESKCSPLARGTAPVSSAGKPSQTMLLTDVRAKTDTCTDRVAFTFRPAQEKVGYRVEYLPAKQAQTEDGSGRHLDIAGKAFLVVRFMPAATADISSEKLDVTYKGPRTLTPSGTRYVRQVTKIGDFEALLAWTIGLSEKRPFKVTSAGSPPHLTIEFG